MKKYIHFAVLLIVIGCVNTHQKNDDDAHQVVTQKLIEQETELMIQKYAALMAYDYANAAKKLKSGELKRNPDHWEFLHNSTARSREKASLELREMMDEYTGEFDEWDVDKQIEVDLAISKGFTSVYAKSKQLKKLREYVEKNRE